MRHNITAALIVIMTVIVFPQMTQAMPCNGFPGPTNSWFIDNVDPSLHLDAAINLKSGSITWNREYFYRNDWYWNSDSVALPGRWPNHARGPSWGIFSHNIYEPNHGLTSWCSPFIGNRNFRFSLMTNLYHGPGRRYGAFVFLRY